MRTLTNQENQLVAGADYKISMPEASDSLFSTVFFVSGDSQVCLGGFTHYASYVTNIKGQKIFEGNDGGFVGMNNSFCVVAPAPIEGGGSVYLYLKSWNN